MKSTLKTIFISSLCFITCIMISMTFGSTFASAKKITIKSPKALRNINWKNKGYGPGHTYVIGNDMTLGDDDHATCRLTKGKFTIDFNGHTVQNANNKLGVFSISGANVTFKDSKVKANKPSVRSYGAGAIDMTSGKLLIKSGNYLGASNGTNNPSALHVGGGTCIVNKGTFYGDTIGADCSGGKLYINGGTFQAGFWFALASMGGGTIKVSKGTFIAGTTTYGYRFPLGAYSPNYQTYDLNNFLAKGSSFSPAFQTGYWNLQASVTAYPTMANYFAVPYNIPTLKVSSSVKKPSSTKIKKISSSQGTAKISWKKVKSGASGYHLLLATNKKFTKNNKSIMISKSSSGSTKVKNLLRGKKYFVKIRTYKKYNGTKLYSKWSKVKKSTIK